MKPSLREQAEEVKTSADLGGAVGAGLTTLVEGIAQAPKALTSAPVLRTVSALLGPPTKVLKQYAQVVDDMTDLPSVEAVTAFFRDVRGRLIEDVAQNAQKKAIAEKNVEALSKALEKAEETASASVKETLATAKEKLKEIKEDLKFQRLEEVGPAFKEQKQRQQEAFKSAEERRKGLFEKEMAERAAALKDPSMGPFVSEVQRATEALKDKVIDQSLAATELIGDDIFFNSRDIQKYLRDQINKLKVRGTDVAAGETANQAIKELAKRIEEAERLPPRITGQQLKDIIKSYDKDLRGTWLKAGEWGESYSNALKDVRKSIDAQLKGANDQYRKAMEDVSSLTNVLNEINSEIKPSRPGSVESAYKRAFDNPRVEQVFNNLEKHSGLEVTGIIKLVQRNRQLKAQPAPKFIPGTPPDPTTLPEYQALQNLKAKQQMVDAQNFERETFKAIKDTEVAQQIINLRREIKLYTDPEYVKAEINQAVAQQKLSLEEAQAALDNINKKQEAAAKYLSKLVSGNVSKPEDLIGTILRASDNAVEQAAATKIIDAVSQLPEEQFGDLLNKITLRNPNDAQKLFRNLRVEDAMNKARTAGSKGVNMMRAVFGAMGGAAAGGGNPAMTALLGGFGAIAGAYRDDMGGLAAKQFLKGAVRLQGIPTPTKLQSLSYAQATSSVRNAINLQIVDMAGATDPKAIYTIGKANIPAVERDIKMSKMSAVDKARALSELNGLGGISGKYIQKIMLESAPAASMMPMSEPQEALEADKPDMAERLSKRAMKQEERGLQGVVRQLRQS